MLDLEDLGGGGLRDAYAVLAMLDVTEDGAAMLVEYEGSLLSLLVPADTTIPVITYAISNMLEIDPSRRPS